MVIPEIQKILIRPRIPTQSPEWEQERKVRISATNTSAILGRTSPEIEMDDL